MRLNGRILLAMTALTGILVGCADTASDPRPRSKPDELVVNVVQPSGKPGMAKLGQARISTKSGDIQILEPDGTVTEFALEGSSPDPFAISEADLMMLNANLDLDLSRVRGLSASTAKPLSAQEMALAAFAARTRPMLPRLPAGFTADPEMFRGVTIERMRDPRADRDGDSGMVTVRANLRRGVDADTAFAYATCALADWADKHDTGFARHVWTEQTRRSGELQLGAVFTLSNSQPMGLKVMDTDQTLQECKARGIPAA